MSNTRRMTLVAMLSAISTLLAAPFLQFSILGIPFLKVDLTILPILIGVFTLGLSSGYIILAVRSVLWFIIWPDGVNTYVGLPMNIVAIGVFILILWFFLRKKFTLAAYVLSGVIATLVMTVLMALLNLVYAIPVYEKFANYPASALSLSKYVIPVVIPFNLLEGVIFTVAFGLLFAILRRNKVIKFYNA